MSGGRWHEGRKAWARLSGWDDASNARHDRDPLDALCNIGSLRRLLDEAELAAVRVARQQKRSWAEIATMLGVTRQSAWERWRDLDESLADGPRGDVPATESAAQAAAVASAASELTDWAKRRRRKATVIVPRVIGMRSAGACAVLEEHGLVPVGLDPDGVRYDKHGWPDRVVTSQSPESGAKVPPGTSVRLWLERGGGAGVREPRRPSPPPRSGREMRPEPTPERPPERADEAVG
ncbi:MAG TPA: PASTA domain-containing protein [Acidothermaceae bacterium]|nr:PASTA domain-containing protein [Acidothermaceae bacterium]